MAEEGGYNQTVIHPLGLLAVLFLGSALVLLPRRYAVLPMVVMACIIPSSQRLVLAGLDFSLLRILMLFGWTRIIMRNEFRGMTWNRLDTLVVAWMVSASVIYVLQNGSASALINRCGWMFQGLGMYFLFRCVIRDWTDLEQLAFGFVIVSFPVALAFALEWQTGRNAFSVFGGVPQFTLVREGRLRCQGAFSHAILAGSFWASVIPLMVAYHSHGNKWLARCGLLFALFIVFACASSTPVMALGFVFIGLGMYRYRQYLRPALLGGSACILLLHFIREQPVWHLIARISAVGGSTGYHRYKIIDATITNFSKWALLGEKDPLSWGVSNMSDITNQYILEALRGGLITLVLFITMFAVAFRMVGATVRRLDQAPQRRILAWCIGVGLFVHAGAFLGVSYFGQIEMLIYLNLAMIGGFSGMTEDGALPVTEGHFGPKSPGATHVTCHPRWGDFL